MGLCGMGVSVSCVCTWECRCACAPGVPVCQGLDGSWGLLLSSPKALSPLAWVFRGRRGQCTWVRERGTLKLWQWIQSGLWASHRTVPQALILTPTTQTLMDANTQFLGTFLVPFCSYLLLKIAFRDSSPVSRGRRVNDLLLSQSLMLSYSPSPR